MTNMKKIAILGSTGSIGTQTLDVIRHFPSDFSVTGLSAGSNSELLLKQAQEFSVKTLHIGDQSKAAKVKNSGLNITSFYEGTDGLLEFVENIDCDLLVVATVGWTGVLPTLKAIERHIPIALANKEVLVCAGELVMNLARINSVPIWPIDSEHNALMQCLDASKEPDYSDVKRLILTCSGGPFRNSSKDEILLANREHTLNHPTWEMGAKITVDSATLMNKGFEAIEAHHLFDLPADQIEIVIHPQSTIHSMVEFVDGSIIAQLGTTDMRLPIQNILTQPKRLETWVEPLNFAKLGTLNFSEPDLDRFPCLRMAFECMRAGGTMPCVLNAANEVAVAAHLGDRITCGQIPMMIEVVLARHSPIDSPSLYDLTEADQWARKVAEKEVKRTEEFNQNQSIDL